MTAAAVPAARPRVLLIDFSSLFWTAWHSSGNDTVSDARQRTLTSVNRCIGAAPGALVAVCCDSGKSWRKDRLPTYKANRPEKDHAAIGELQRAQDRLRADGMLLWSVDGYEADDLIATASHLARIAGHEVLLASADKDLLQLVDDAAPAVRCLRTHTWNEVGAVQVRERFGVGPARLGDWLALVGDKGDNIPGAPGIGEKKAAALLDAFGSLTAVLDAAEYQPERVAKVIGPATTAKLSENLDTVGLARTLVALKVDAPINFNDIYSERRPAPLVGEENPDMDAEAEEFTEEKSEQGPAEPAPPAEKPTENAPPAPPAPESRALAVVPVEYERALEPTTIGNAYKLAQGLLNSRLYNRFNNPESIMAVIIRGREMGLGALTALDSFHVIEGKPAPHAMLIIARAKAHPDCEYFQCVETTAKSATWETKNRNNPKPTRLTYTLEQARGAGLVRQGGNWEKRPDEMVRKTAGVQLARMEYPDAALGLYAFEELGGE